MMTVPFSPRHTERSSLTLDPDFCGVSVQTAPALLPVSSIDGDGGVTKTLEREMQNNLLLDVVFYINI